MKKNVPECKVNIVSMTYLILYFGSGECLKFRTTGPRKVPF